mmetsp:Transcript_21873/g.57079  ORF Transcript_21873/g.57079 Transcript_21873/m.57079 type:complete len:85 (+) Transcript_21873:273-527(+)
MQDPRQAPAVWVDGRLRSGAGLPNDERELKDEPSQHSSVAGEGASGFCKLDWRSQIADAKAPTCRAETPSPRRFGSSSAGARPP